MTGKVTCQRIVVTFPQGFCDQCFKECCLNPLEFFVNVFVNVDAQSAVIGVDVSFDISFTFQRKICVNMAHEIILGEFKSVLNGQVCFAVVRADSP